jgi:hypothetical protein
MTQQGSGGRTAADERVIVAQGTAQEGGQRAKDSALARVDQSGDVQGIVTLPGRP